MHRESKLCLTIAALLAAPAFVIAGEAPTRTEPDIRQLQEQIRALQERVKQLESQQTTLSTQAVNETVERVLRDADRRSQLLQMDGGLTAGFANDRFFIASADGNWSWMPILGSQFRNVTNWLQDENDLQNGFEVRTMKFGFNGTAVTQDLSYFFLWATNSNGGSVTLDDAFVAYNVGHDVSVKAGQYYDPWVKEQNISEFRQLAVDRSLMNQLIGGGQTGRVQGVSLIRDVPQYRAEVMLNDGANTQNTNWEDGNGGGTFLNGGTNWGASGRFDWYFFGRASEAQQLTALGATENMLVVGSGLEYTEGGDNKAFFHTVDAQWVGANGWSFYGAYIGVYRDLGTLGTGFNTGDFYDWGCLLQAAYLITPKWEIFARYDYTDLDPGDLPAGTTNEVHEITVGANHYFHRQNVKFTIDGIWLPSGSPTDATKLGILAADGNEFVLRTQLQLRL